MLGRDHRVGFAREHRDTRLQLARFGGLFRAERIGNPSHPERPGWPVDER
jgi:hypothetical protein